MDTYVINLDRSKDRWLMFEARNARLMPRLRRFAAVDGATLDRAALAARGLIDAGLDYANGALGNALSHLALWDLALRENRPITVCEDDAVLNHNFLTALDGLRLPGEWHFIAWGWNFDSVLAFDLIPGVSSCVARFDQNEARRGIAKFQAAAVRPTLFRLVEFFGTIGYSVSPAGAWALKELCLPLRNRTVPVQSLGRTLPNTDLGILLNAALRRINAYVSFPPLVLTPNEHVTSTIQPSQRAAAPAARPKPRRESLLVIMPSRLQRDADGDLMLRKAIASVFRQNAAPLFDIDLVIGVDPGAAIPARLDLPWTVRFVEAGAASQAAALNAAARSFDHAYLAIIEDDDEWRPEFLGLAFEALQRVDFVSSTQLEVDTRGETLSTFDFPTPSGWVMRRAVWERVGAFDAAYRFHLDKDWLGRLAEAGTRRGHLVEATAPVAPERVAALRPDLHRVVTEGGPSSTLVRHAVPVPLVRRAVHPGSGMYAVRTDEAARGRSEEEYAQLRARYGRVPW